ncbi:MAG: response regulator [Myxococcales bacterium]|nr:response regulator [Myxococcales bacterium]
MSARPRLLVIDDNRELADNLVELFEERGFAVEVVPSAAAGLATARERGFDLAFVDVNLPDTSGHELVPALRSACPYGEVLLMTGHASIDSAIAAVRVGAFQYVVKPFNVAELVATVDRALSQVQLRAEREALSRQLAESERRYRDVVDSTGVLVFAIDRQARVVIANRRACDTLGVTAEELVGLDFFTRCLAQDGRASARSRVESVLRGHGVVEFDAPLTAKSGPRSVRWHATQAAVGAKENDARAYLTGVDVTERLELERRAAESEALAHMGTLAAGLAHEIRNPLNAAGLQLHLLGRAVDRLPDGEERAPLKNRVEIVASELKRLEHLLGDFLELARPRPIARESVDLVRLLDRVLSLHEPIATTRNIMIERKFERASARGDHDRLEQVFHNLVVNALEASSDGGTIEVTVEREEGPSPTVLASVRDTGRGIPEATLARIYEPFFTTKPAGTGLGLTIVRQIVQRHGGAVLIDSTEGRGTRVSIRLPAASP